MAMTAPASPGRLAAGEKGRLSLEIKYGPDWAKVIGRMGGRPNFWQALDKARARALDKQLKRKRSKRRSAS